MYLSGGQLLGYCNFTVHSSPSPKAGRKSLANSPPVMSAPWRIGQRFCSSELHESRLKVWRAESKSASGSLESCFAFFAEFALKSRLPSSSLELSESKGVEDSGALRFRLAARGGDLTEGDGDRSGPDLTFGFARSLEESCLREDG